MCNICEVFLQKDDIFYNMIYIQMPVVLVERQTVVLGDREIFHKHTNTPQLCL